RGVDGRRGWMRIHPELRGLVRFERVNLCDPALPVAGRFDVIFCRNVLIYFRPPERLHVVRRLAERLTAGGLLFLGHAETVNGLADQLQSVAPNVYEPR